MNGVNSRRLQINLHRGLQTHNRKGEQEGERKLKRKSSGNFAHTENKIKSVTNSPFQLKI